MADVEQMRADLARNEDPGSMKHLDVLTREYLADTLWPFLSNILDKIEEQDGTIDELIEQTEDVLHAETAQEIGKPIGIGLLLCTELEKRLTTQPSDIKLRATIAEYRQSAKVALETLQDVAIPDGPDDGEESTPANGSEPDDEDDDPDDDDDEEDDGE